MVVSSIVPSHFVSRHLSRLKRQARPPPTFSFFSSRTLGEPPNSRQPPQPSIELSPEGYISRWQIYLMNHLFAEVLTAQQTRTPSTQLPPTKRQCLGFSGIGAGLLENPKYADLEIRCRDKSFKVHQNIVWCALPGCFRGVEILFLLPQSFGFAILTRISNSAQSRVLAARVDGGFLVSCSFPTQPMNAC